MDPGKPAAPNRSQNAHVAVPSLSALREKLQSQLGRLTLLRHKCEALQLQQRERRNEIFKLRAHCIELDGEASRHEVSATLLSQVRPHAASPLHVAVWNILHTTGFLALGAETTPPAAAPAARRGSHPPSDADESSAQSSGALHRNADGPPPAKDGHLGSASSASVESDDRFSRLLVPLSTGPSSPASSSYPSGACITAPTALESFRSFIFHPAFVAFHPQGSVLHVDRWWRAPVDAVLCNSTSWLAAVPPASHSPACTAGASCTSLHPADVACMHGLQALFDHISSQISSYSAIVDSLSRPSPGMGTAAATGGTQAAPQSAPSHSTAGSTELDWSQVTPYLTDAEQERLIQAYVALDAASDAERGVALPVSTTTGANAAREGATKLLSILVATASVRRNVGLLPLSQQVQFLMHASKLGKRLLYSAGSSEEGDGGIDRSLSTSVDAGESAVLPGTSGQVKALVAASSHTYMRWPVLAPLWGPLNVKKHAEMAASLLLCAPLALALCTWAGAAHGNRSYPLSPVLVHRGPSTSKGSSSAWSEVCTLVPLVRALTSVQPALLASTYTRTLGLRAPFTWLHTTVQRAQRKTAGKWRRDVADAASGPAAAGASKRLRLTSTHAAGATHHDGTAETKTTLVAGAATHGFMAFDSVAVSVQGEEANDDESDDLVDEEEDTAEGDGPTSAPVRASVHAFGTLPAAVSLPGRRQAVVSQDKTARLLRAVGRRQQPCAITGELGGSSATIARVGQDDQTPPVHKSAQASKNGGSDRYHSSAVAENGAPTGHTAASSGHAVGAQGQALYRLLCTLATTPLSTSSSMSTGGSVLGGDDKALPHVPEDVTRVTLQAFRRLARAIGAHAAHPVINALHGLEQAADDSLFPPAGVLQGLCEAAGPTGSLLWSCLTWKADGEHSSDTPPATSTGDTRATHPGLANVFISWARYRLTALSALGAAGSPALMCGYTPAVAASRGGGGMSPALYCVLVMQQAKHSVTGGHAVRLHDFLLQSSLPLVRVHVQDRDRRGGEHWCAVRLVLAAWHVLEDAGQEAYLHASIAGVLQAARLLPSEPLSPSMEDMTAPLSALSSPQALYLAHIAVHYLRQGVLPASESTAASLPGSVACRWAMMSSEQELKTGEQSEAGARRDAIASIAAAVVSHSVGGWASQAAAARVLSLCDVAYNRLALSLTSDGRPQRLLCTPPLRVWLRMPAALAMEEDISSLAQGLTGEILGMLSSPTPEQAVLVVLQAAPALVPLLAAGRTPAVGTSSTASLPPAVASCSGLLAILGASRSAGELIQAVEAVQKSVSSGAARHSTDASSLSRHALMPACDAAVEVWATALLEGSRQHCAQPFASMLGEQEADVQQNALSLVSVPVLALYLQLATQPRGQSRTVVPALTLRRCIAAVRTALHVSTAAMLASSGDTAGSHLPQPAFIPALLAEALSLLQYASTSLTLLDMQAGCASTSMARGVVHQKTWEQGLIDGLLFQAMGTELGSSGSMAFSAQVHALRSSVEAAAATACALSAQLAPLAFLAPGITVYEARVQAMLCSCLSVDGLTSHVFTIEPDSTAGARKPKRSTAAHPQTRGAGTMQPPVMDTVSLVHSSALHPLLQASPPMISMSDSMAQGQGSGCCTPTTHVLSSLAPWRGACPVYLTALHGRCVTALATTRDSVSGWDPAGTLTQVVDNAYSSGALLPDPFHVATVRHAAKLGDALASAVLKSLSDRDTSAHGLPGWPLLGPVLPQLMLPALSTPLIAALAARAATSSADERRAVVAQILPRCASPEAVTEVWRSSLRSALTESLPVHAAAIAALWLSSQPLSAGAWKVFVSMVTMHADCCARLSSRHAGSPSTLTNPTVAAGAGSDQGGGGLSSSEAHGVRALLSSVAVSHGVLLD